MERRILLALLALLCGCQPVSLFWPGLYHVERPPLHAPGWAGTATAVGLNLTHGPSPNTIPSTITGLQLAWGAYGSAFGRWMSLRGTGMLSLGTIGNKGYGALIAVAEPALTLPLASWLSLGLVGETAAGLEFGPYAPQINTLAFWEGAVRASFSVGVGGAVAVHFSEREHAVVDFRFLPGSFRFAYIGSPWGVHASYFLDQRFSAGVSYLLQATPERRRR